MGPSGVSIWYIPSGVVSLSSFKANQINADCSIFIDDLQMTGGFLLDAYLLGY